MATIARIEQDLTPQWFMQALSQSKLLGQSNVRRVQTEAVGAGQMGRVVRATLSLDGSGESPLVVIVKMASTDPDSLRMCLALGIYEPEVRFYQEIAHAISMPVPACHFAAIDEASGLFTIVMEDLSRIARSGDVLAGGSVDQAGLAIKALVGLQAPLWNAEHLRRRAWLNHQRTVGLFGNLPAGLEPFLDRFGAGLNAEQTRLIRRALPHAKAWAENWAGPWCPVHGDYRLDNMMFGITPDAPPLIVIDWQTLRLGSPLLDAAYYLGACLSTADRRANERHLIVDYHQRLIAAGIEGFGFDDCWTSYRRYSLYGLLMIVGITAGIQQTERGDAMLLSVVRQYADLAIDLDAAEFLPR